MNCPFIKMIIPNDAGEKKELATKCLEHNCELWTTLYTTELNQVSGCAFRMNAMKNSEGQIRV